MEELIKKKINELFLWASGSDSSPSEFGEGDDLLVHAQVHTNAVLLGLGLYGKSLETSVVESVGTVHTHLLVSILVCHLGFLFKE